MKTTSFAKSVIGVQNIGRIMVLLKTNHDINLTDQIDNIHGITY